MTRGARMVDFIAGGAEEFDRVALGQVGQADRQQVRAATEDARAFAKVARLELLRHSRQAATCQ